MQEDKRAVDEQGLEFPDFSVKQRYKKTAISKKISRTKLVACVVWLFICYIAPMIISKVIQGNHLVSILFATIVGRFVISGCLKVFFEQNWGSDGFPFYFNFLRNGMALATMCFLAFFLLVDKEIWGWIWFKEKNLLAIMIGGYYFVYIIWRKHSLYIFGLTRFIDAKEMGYKGEEIVLYTRYGIKREDQDNTVKRILLTEESQKREKIVHRKAFEENVMPIAADGKEREIVKDNAPQYLAQEMAIDPSSSEGDNTDGRKRRSDRYKQDA